MCMIVLPLTLYMVLMSTQDYQIWNWCYKNFEYHMSAENGIWDLWQKSS